MGESRLNQIGSLLESKNRTVRLEAANAFENFSLCDQSVVDVLLHNLCSNSWDTRVAAAEALAAVLRGTAFPEVKEEEKSAISQLLLDLDVTAVYKTYKPLLSMDATNMATSSKASVSSRQQRKIIDQHLDFNAATGISSFAFLNDSDVVAGSAEESPSRQEAAGENLSTTVKEEDDAVSPDEGASEVKALQRFVVRLLSSLASQDWQHRHGVALALNRIFCSYSGTLPWVIKDDCIIRLLQILILDQFVDYASGRNSVAPVRETCAQTVAYALRNTTNFRTNLILQRVRDMVATAGDKLWHCRQSALLVMKYYFAIVPSFSAVEEIFTLVLECLKDSVDDVVSCAVLSLASFLTNMKLGAERDEIVNNLMRSVWELLHSESQKICADSDGLIIDLLTIIESWLSSYEIVTLDRTQVMTIIDFLDPLFQTRTQKVVSVLSACLVRGGSSLNEEDVFRILKGLYRILLFSAPSDTTTQLEMIYLTSVRLIDNYRAEVQSNMCLIKCVGLWSNCLMLDHKNPMIDVFAHSLDSPSNSRDSPQSLMCSEEIGVLSDREKDAIFVTRKILSAKFLALILQTLYESSTTIGGQEVSHSVQLLFVPFLKSNSLYQVLGAVILINEWAALYKTALNRGVQMNPPMAIVSHLDEYLKAPQRTYDEMAASVSQLTQDCGEFVDYCAARGVDKSSLHFNEHSSVEDISRLAYEQCLVLLTSEKQREPLETRYRLVSELMEFTKMAVKSNTARVFAFISSALFYFGFAPEKLTPMVRPLVECMQMEDNETVSAEVFKGAVPLMVMYSWSRTPKPYVKVLARVMDGFTSCSQRIPKPAEWEEKGEEILSLLQRDAKPSAMSRNAELMLLVCSSFAVEQIPEYFENFSIDSCEDDLTLISRLEMHGCLWSRVGSCLTDASTERILSLLQRDNPALRYAGAKAVATFARSQLGFTMSRLYDRLVAMLADLDDDNRRKGAVEAVFRLSLLGSSLTGAVSLLAPIIFPRLADRVAAIRTAASEAFRNLVPLLALENVNTPLFGASEALLAKRQADADFIHVLSSPSQLPLVETAAIPGLCDGIELRHYQMEGITWMRFLRRFGLNGILADDMGLGKTLQTMCAIALSSEEKSPASLIVCPRTLVDHWVNEWRRFFPTRTPAAKADHSWLKKEIVVVAYEDLKSGRLQRQAWNYVVLDEGHVMRNPKSVIWRVANELKAKSRLILSGTPVQNTPADLWALFAWLMPGYLGDEKQFRIQFLKAILRCRNPKASEQEIAEGQATIGRLHKLILPFVMRRMKNEVLKELPDKNIQDYECELTDDQKQIYQYIVERCTSNKERLADGSGITPLSALYSLRKLLDHPRLVLPVLQQTGAPQALIDKAGPSAASGKLAALGQILNECGIGTSPEEGDEDEEGGGGLIPALQMPHRALIFCQWKASVDLVTEALDRGTFGSRVPHMVLDGSVPVNARQAVVDRFNADHSIDVLVLTTHVGGVGLNLTGADVVIFLDHDWNPMKDLQAIDRAHRLGQTKKVNVYRLITQGTVEERVMSLQRFKINTADALIGADNRSLQSMATQELINMFTLEKEGGGEATEAPKKKKKAVDPASEEQWNLADLWDESQYEEQFNVKQFANSAQ